jgi:hypothetical protein
MMLNHKIKLLLLVFTITGLMIVPFAMAESSNSEKEDNDSNAVPILRLEKPKYVLGETIRFWIGVKRINDNVIIPQKFWNSCFLYITKPDKTLKREPISWPVDGDPYRGWMGGCGLGEESVQIGKYTLVVEFAGKQTEPVELIVDDLDILKNIKAAFIFKRAGNISKDEHIPIVLTVQNNSENVIRFPKRGCSDAYISVSVGRREPAARADFFYPIKKSSDISFDTYNWNTAGRIPEVILKKGESFEQELSLEDAYKFQGPGQYQVTFSTVLSLLIGEENDKFAEYSPLRLSVTATEKFQVVKQE